MFNFFCVFVPAVWFTYSITGSFFTTGSFRLAVSEFGDVRSSDASAAGATFAGACANCRPAGAQLVSAQGLQVCVVV